MKLFICTLLLAASTPLAAELSNSGDTGFTVNHSVETGAEAFFAYRTMTAHIDQWWGEAHTWSGNAWTGIETGFANRRSGRLDGSAHHCLTFPFEWSGA